VEDNHLSEPGGARGKPLGGGEGAVRSPGHEAGPRLAPSPTGPAPSNAGALAIEALL
jgi:hypothetical protein